MHTIDANAGTIYYAHSALFGPDGTLYGAAVDAHGSGGIVWSLKPGAATMEVIHTITGAYPYSLVRDDAGNLYGIAAKVTHQATLGQLYRLSPPATGTRWTYTKLHHFSGDAPNPDLTLVDGTIYGVSGFNHDNAGTVFTYSLK